MNAPPLLEFLMPLAAAINGLAKARGCPEWQTQAAHWRLGEFLAEGVSDPNAALEGAALVLDDEQLARDADERRIESVLRERRRQWDRAMKERAETPRRSRAPKHSDVLARRHDLTEGDEG
jgi:hypothetical protein